MAAVNPMKPVYDRLKEFGFPRAFVRKRVLPQWWDDEIAADPVGLTEALLIISRNLGINFRSLRDTGEALYFDTLPTRFSNGPELAEIDPVAPAVAERAMRTALLGCPSTGELPRSSAAALRSKLLFGKKYIGFSDLLAYCWKNGIPVVHIEELPEKAHRLAGVTCQEEDRHAIALGLRYRSPARQIFFLAHEIAHIQLQHIEGRSLLADTEAEIKFNNRTEAEANAYARTLLTGNQLLPSWYLELEYLPLVAEETRRLGEELQIDPGHLLWQWGNQSRNVVVAQSLLSTEIEPGQNAVEIINNEMNARLRWEDIPADSRHFLRGITGSRQK